MPRKWIDAKAAVLVDEASQLGMTIDHIAARDALQYRLSASAAAMGISEVSARRYLEDSVVREMARDLVTSFADEHPGLDLATAEPDAQIEPRLAALAVTALSEAVLVHLANPGTVAPGLAGECVGMLSVHGTRLYASHGTDAVAVSRAWLRRAARYIDTAADTIERGGALGSPSEVSPRRLVSTFRADAQLLRNAAGP